MRWALVNRPLRSDNPRDAAFHRYLKKVRRIMKRDPAVFEVVDNRLMAAGPHSVIRELTLRTAALVEPGDMLHVWWRNAPERAAAHIGSFSEGYYWSTPIPHRPSRRNRYTAEELAGSIVDLSMANPPSDLLVHSVAEHTGALSPTDSIGDVLEFPNRPVASATVSANEGVENFPRITPRFYTTSSARRDEDATTVRIQVTYVDSWPKRAAAFLQSLEPGESLDARVLPHPHRVPLDVPGGLAITTGSGAASVFAALRGGAQGIHLIWGLGDKTLEPWVREELAQYLDSGALGNLETAHSPTRVTDILKQTPDLSDYLAKWIYVSGNEAMGYGVDSLLSTALGPGVLEESAASMAYTVST